MAEDLNEYLWIAIVGSLFGFIYAFGIGANDVANSFASVVASKSLTLRQAVVVAGIFEFAGAILLGASVTGTVKGKIFNVKLYADEPDIVMLGMFTSLISGSIMLLGATAYGLPVSTTHTIVGAIMGFTICAKGFDSVQWEEAKKIFVSWAVSPLVSGFTAFVFMMFLRLVILNYEDEFTRAYYTFPFILTAGIGIDIFYVLYKGFNNMDFSDKLDLNWVLPMAFGVGAFVGLLWLVCLGPMVRKGIQTRRAAKDEEAANAAKSAEEGDVDENAEATKEKSDSSDAVEKPVATPVTSNAVEKPVMASAHPTEAMSSHFMDLDEPDANAAAGGNAINRFISPFVDQDLHAQSMHESKRALEIWESAEIYDEDTEQLFSYIQVFTSCLNSFGHGANDVANAIAPMSAIIQIYQDGVVKSKSDVQKWILAYGGAAIVLGFLFFGTHTIKSIGYKLTMLSPTRGATAELASSLFIVTASFLEIPVSSTQCITGAISGVGLAHGYKNVQWLFLLKVCISWAGVFFCAVLLNAGIFSMFAFSPSLTSN